MTYRCRLSVKRTSIFCVSECGSGYYGVQCTEACGAGCEGGACNTTDGTCLCLSGWKPPMCRTRRKQENFTGDHSNSCPFNSICLCLDLLTRSFDGLRGSSAHTYDSHRLEYDSVLYKRLYSTWLPHNKRWSLKQQHARTRTHARTHAHTHAYTHIQALTGGY